MDGNDKDHMGPIKSEANGEDPRLLSGTRVSGLGLQDDLIVL